MPALFPQPVRAGQQSKALPSRPTKTTTTTRVQTHTLVCSKAT